MDGFASDWLTASLSADQEILRDLTRLRQRARSLCNDSPHARRFLNLLAENVVGTWGQDAQPVVRNARGELMRDLNRAIKREFVAWGAPEFASADGACSWVDLQRLCLQLVAMDGECFVRLIGGADNRWGFSLVVLDADQCDHTFSQTRGERTPEIRQGVEVNEYGRPVAYWLWTNHPSEHGRARERVRVPADQIVHLLRRERPSQTRGVPWFAASIVRARMLDKFHEATLIAARSSASAMGVVTSSAEDGAIDPNAAHEPLNIEVSPGAFVALPPGTDLKTWAPAHPDGVFEPFTKAILRDLAASWNVSYASLTGDMSDSSFSAARLGSLQERDGFAALQEWLSTHFLTPVYKAWLRYAVLSGAVSVPNADAARCSGVAFQGRGYRFVDPTKEAEAIRLLLALRLASRTSVCAEMGKDYEEILDELAEEQRLADERGVPLPDPAAMLGVSHTATGGEGAEGAGGDAAEEDGDGEEDEADGRGARLRAVR